MTTARTALVTGATGAIGPTLVRYLLESGWCVRTLSRRKPAELPPAVDTVVGSITDTEAVSRSLEGIHTVFHLAAMLHIENPSPDMESEYQRINVGGTGRLVEQAVRFGIRKFVYFSTVKVYGIHQRDPVNESFAPQPKTMYARSKYEGEQAARAANGLETVILRLSPVYGPHVKGSWARLIRAIQRGWFIPVGSLGNVHSLTHVDDVAQAAMLVADHDKATGECYNLVAHDSPTLDDIFSAIYRSIGRSMPPVRVPASLAFAGAYLGERVFQIVGRRSPLPFDALRQLVEDEAYSGEKLRRIGFTPKIPLDQGWSEAVKSN